MKKRAYVYVDGENHFHRSEEVASEFLKSHRALEALSETRLPIVGERFPRTFSSERRFGWNANLTFFWDVLTVRDTREYEISQAVYVCATSGGEEEVHEGKVWLRNNNFEPLVIKEAKHDRSKRENDRKNHKLIDKPKGCDIALATRMVADAAADRYDYCFLFTSDADFLPAVEAVQGMGKVVWVFGYKTGLLIRSKYLYVPQRFIDLDESLRQALSRANDLICRKITELESQSNC
jgi:uncharacterized LabA/DUF88 family protein